MNKQKLLNEAYDILNSSTPLRKDCGLLCDSACCKGDKNTGMYLFPGEEKLHRNSKFLTLKQAGTNFKSNKTVTLAVCSGECIRSLRPLACRLFPLTPYLTRNNILMIRMDPRAVKFCPLARYYSRRELEKSFVKNVRKACRLLIADNDIHNFIYELSRELDWYFQMISGIREK